MERIYLCIDLKSFYASVECVERGLDPLSTNLVVADPSRTEKTICLAVTPSLKAYGISGRARLFEVNQKIREIKQITGKQIDYIIAPPQMQLYIDYSAKIYSVYLKYVSHEDIHVYSIDEVFMDITQYLFPYNKNPKRMASAIIKEVLNTTGITATAGIGTNLFLAKIAMDIVAKHTDPDKDGTRIAFLDELQYKQLLWDHKPITDFWGIGKGISSKLASRGIYTMGDIAQTSIRYEDLLYRLFGINAELLIDHAWGIETCTIKDIKRYRPSANSLSSGQILSCNYSFEKAKLVVKEMVDALVLEMLEKGMATDSITLDIGYDRNAPSPIMHLDHYGHMSPKPSHGSAKLGLPTTSTKKIIDTALEIYDRIVDKDIGVRRITVIFNHVEPEAYQQLDLFSDTVQQEKEKSIQHTMLKIKRKYGKNAILKGMNFEDGATMRDRNKQIGGHKA